ncbi:hypothetical protein ARALYDRAFT_356408 [Arabidopsis lyrata subsp. lyrata]|uniref:Uncharacterized protein n=1 Tax=Arabidopsis lyrata subsp. lyrata TaxID=81972 RepID=D7MSP5_ARALL|nr:hypothetical protein ARALYDRAFT_356408 [Arabidopsis lyrata subsp. lyrata]
MPSNLTLRRLITSVNRVRCRRMVSRLQKLSGRSRTVAYLTVAVVGTGGRRGLRRILSWLQIDGGFGRCDLNRWILILEKSFESEACLLQILHSFFNYREEEVSLETLSKKMDDFAKARDWEKYHIPRNLLLAMVGEVGELSEIFQWKGEVARGCPDW